MFKASRQPAQSKRLTGGRATLSPQDPPPRSGFALRPEADIHAVRIMPVLAENINNGSFGETGGGKQTPSASRTSTVDHIRERYVTATCLG